jgi:hypothetical protein
MTIAELLMASCGFTELVPPGETSQNAMVITGLSPAGSTDGEKLAFGNSSGQG